MCVLSSVELRSLNKLLLVLSFNSVSLISLLQFLCIQVLLYQT